MKGGYIKAFRDKYHGEVSGRVLTELKDFEGMCKFEKARFDEIRNMPIALFDIEHVDVLMSPKALSMLFRCGGFVWLQELYAFMETLDEGSVPIRWNNTLHNYRPLGDLVLNEELATLAVETFLWPLDCIGEEDTLEELMYLFCVRHNETECRVIGNGVDTLRKVLNKPFKENPDETFEYRIAFLHGEQSVTINADHLQEDVIATTITLE